MPHKALRRFALILLCCLAHPATGIAQTLTGSVSGFVRDTADGEGLIRATVLVEGVNCRSVG